MNKFTFLEKLNYKLESYCKDTDIKKVALLAGNVDETLLLTLKEKAPFSKVALLFTEKSAKKLLAKYQTLLKRQGYKVHSVIIKEQALYSVDDLLDASVIPEDVRVIVTFDHNLLTPLKYSATINNLPAIFVSANNQIENLLDGYDYIKNGSTIDEFKFCSEFTTIFNNELELEDDLNVILLGYASILNAFDYEIGVAVKGEKSKDNTDLFLTKEGLSKDKGFFERAVNYHVSNFLSLGDLERKSAFTSVKKAFVLANGKMLNLNDKARIIKALFTIYKFGISQAQSQILEITDYLGMITKACKRLKLDVFSKSENFLKFLDDMAKNSISVDKSLEKVLKVINFDGLFDDFDEIFHLEKAKPKKDLRTYILDGVCVNPYNVLGVLTSKGILENIL